MKDLNVEVDLESHLADFLENFVPKEEPFVIAFSGGPDSTALLYSIVAVAEGRHPCVVHVDHGWRKESSDEAKKLEAQAVSLGIPFHSFKLPPAPQGENLEDWSRRERLQCFSKLGAKIVLLAHHADDQIEVVLKRFLEGSSIKNFRGMRAIEERDGLTLMRPLLPFRKRDLLSWVELRKIPYLDDPTNRDPKYLRARFRENLLPSLRESLGKEFEESLLRVSEEARHLDEWLQESLREAFSYGEGRGFAYATSRKEGLSSFLVQHLVDKLRKMCCLPAPSRSQVMEAVSCFLGEARGGKTFFVGRGVILVERGWMGVFTEKLLPVPEIMCDQKEGKTFFSCWEVSWKKTSSCETPKTTWQELFQGKDARIIIPEKDFTISRSSDRFLKSMRGASSTPTSLRPFVPAILQEGQLVADFLTGYAVPIPEGSSCYEVTVRLVDL